MRGHTDWTPQRLTWVALLMAWDEGQTLSQRFEHARQFANDQHRHWKLGSSYSGFTKAFVRSSTLTEALKRRFQRQMQQIAGEHWRRGRWLAFAVDGTRIEAPHTAANEIGLGCAGRDKTAPQVFLTMLWHMGTGLPWDYRLGPGTDSERTHLKQLIPTLPPQAMIVADAGFVGYDLCRELLRQGHSFLLRVGGNITLLENLGYFPEERDGLVYLWPGKFRQGRPLVLRHIVLPQGQQEVHLLTNVLDESLLSDAEAACLFALRWGEEVFFRSYKQTFQRRTLLSRTPETCLAEVQWTLLGLWLLGLLTVSRLLAQGEDPLRCSMARARDAVRRALRGPQRRRGHRCTLDQELSQARIDTYCRRGSKRARNYPRKKREKPPSPPKIRTASPSEIQKASGLPPPEIKLRWTA